MIGVRTIGAAACSIALALAGCGYTLGFKAPPGVRTIAVPVFYNATFPLRREVEFDLTSAFRQEIQARTSLRIVDSAANPDLIVRGRIVDFRERVVAETRRDVKTESNIVSTVDLEIENYVAGTMHKQRVTDVQPFSIEAGETFDVGRQRAIRNIAEKLLVAIEDWGPDADGETPAEAGGP